MHSQDDDKTVVADIELDLLYSLQSNDGEEFPIENQLTFGRSSENTVFINDKKISRKHALLTFKNNFLQIKDLDSSNGTFVNGNKINKITTLKNKDIISIEKHVYTVCVEMKENIVKRFSENPEINEADSTDSNKGLLDESEVPLDSEKNVEIQSTTDKASTDNVLNEDIPASWIEDTGTVAGTRMMDMSELAKLRAGPNIVRENESGITQIHCFIEGVEEVFELPIKDVNTVSGWEIGRDSSCDIAINHASVSGRHAQIIHQNGRWKIVNLVSTNGILINGQRKLSTYLADGDKVGLGTVDLVFNIPKNSCKASHENKNTKNTKASNNILVPLLMVMLLIVLSAIIYIIINK